MFADSRAQKTPLKSSTSTMTIVATNAARNNATVIWRGGVAHILPASDLGGRIEVSDEIDPATAASSISCGSCLRLRTAVPV